MTAKKKEKLLRYAALGLGGVWLLHEMGIAEVGASGPRIINVVDNLPRSGTLPRRSLSAITTIFVHHAGGPGDEQDFARAHIKLGYGGIGYHFVIHKDGRILQTQELETISRQAKNNNSYSVGVCLIGNFETDVLGSVQENALVELLRYLRGRLGDVRILPHRAVRQTACPGADVMKKLDRIIQRAS